MTTPAKTKIERLFKEFKKISPFKQIKLTVLPNGVYRYDVVLRAAIHARLICDPYARVPDMILIGYLDQANFKALNHFSYQLQVESNPPTEEARALSLYLHRLALKYANRIRH